MMQKSLDIMSFILVNYQCRSCTKLSIPRTTYKTKGMSTRKQRRQQFIKNEFDACGKTFKHGKFEVSKINQLQQRRSKIFQKVRMSLHISMHIIYTLVHLLQNNTKISSFGAKHAKVLIRYFETTLRQKLLSTIFTSNSSIRISHTGVNNAQDSEVTNHLG